MSVIAFNKHTKLVNQYISFLDILINGDPTTDILKPLIANQDMGELFREGLKVMVGELLTNLRDEFQEILNIPEKDLQQHQFTMVKEFDDWVKDKASIGSWAITLANPIEESPGNIKNEYVQYIFSKNPLTGIVRLSDIYTEKGNVASRLLNTYTELSDNNPSISKIVLGGKPWTQQYLPHHDAECLKL